MELLILSKLKWDLSAVTPYDFLHHLLRLLEVRLFCFPLPYFPPILDSCFFMFIFFLRRKVLYYRRSSSEYKNSHKPFSSAVPKILGRPNNDSFFFLFFFQLFFPGFQCTRPVCSHQQQSPRLQPSDCAVKLETLTSQNWSGDFRFSPGLKM